MEIYYPGVHYVQISTVLKPETPRKLLQLSTRYIKIFQLCKGKEAFLAVSSSPPHTKQTREIYISYC